MRAGLGHERRGHLPILDTQCVAAAWLWVGGGAGMEGEIRPRKSARTRWWGL